MNDADRGPWDDVPRGLGLVLDEDRGALPYTLPLEVGMNSSGLRMPGGLIVTQEIEQFIRTLLRCRIIATPQAAHKPQELGASELLIKRGSIRYVSNESLRIHRRPQRIMITDMDFAGSRTQHTGNHANRGGLARTVRPQKTEDLSRT